MVQQTTFQSGGTVNLAFGASVKTGDVVTVTCAENFAQSVLSVSGLGTFSVVAGPGSTGFNPGWAILAGQVTTPGTALTVAGTSGSLNCAAQEWRGLTTTVDGQNSLVAPAPGSAGISVSVGASTSHDLLLAVLGNNASTLGTPSGAPWNALNKNDSNVTADPIYQLNVGSGTFIANDSWVGNHIGGAAIVALKAIGD